MVDDGTYTQVLYRATRVGRQQSTYFNATLGNTIFLFNHC